MSDLDAEEIDQTGDDEVTSLEEGRLLDYITGEPVKDTPKEQVRQRIARALLHEYGISVEDMAADFKMEVDGRQKRIDIAIFEPGSDKTPENLRRVVICDKEPKTGSKGAYKMRDHKQAEKEFGLLYAAMSHEQTEQCRWGLWTNGLDFFFHPGFLSVQEELRAFVEHNLFGADFDPFPVRAAQMNVPMASNDQARVFNMNSVEFPARHLQGVAEARGKADQGSMDEAGA